MVDGPTGASRFRLVTGVGHPPEPVGGGILPSPAAFAQVSLLSTGGQQREGMTKTRRADAEHRGPRAPTGLDFQVR